MLFGIYLRDGRANQGRAGQGASTRPFSQRHSVDYFAYARLFHVFARFDSFRAGICLWRAFGGLSYRCAVGPLGVKLVEALRAHHKPVKKALFCNMYCSFLFWFHD